MSRDPNPYAPPQARIEHPLAEYPWWVKMSMWGVPGRGGLWGFVAISLAGALGSLAYGVEDRRFFTLVPLFLVGALSYWQSIRWVDRHGSWAKDA